jgi:outer membrane protein insertion porin family
MKVMKSRPGLALAWIVLVAAPAFPAAAQKFPLQDISVEGSERWPASAVIAESGLRLGDPVDPADFEAAVGHLHQTGSLTEVRFAYEASTGGGAPGYALKFQVREVNARTPVILDIEALGNSDVWNEVRSFAPFAGPEIADTPEAEAYLRKALEQLIERRTGAPLALGSDIEADLGAGSAVLVFRPADLPQLSAFHVEGAKAVQESAIHAAMDHLAVGEPYTERRFRRYLEANVLPLYGAVGRLKASFTDLSTKPGQGSGSVEATIRVEEGAEYRLKDVALRGEVDDAPALLKQADFPVGKRAELPRIQAALEVVSSAFKRHGYLGVRLDQAQSFDDETQGVTWRITVERGPQFVFGALNLVGLDEKAEQTVRKRWKLAEGEPMNQPYIAEWAKDAVTRLDATGIAQDLKVRPNSQIVDVFITFRAPQR